MNTPRFVVMFSSGISSWAAARRIADKHGTDGLVLLFADTLIEDEDNYRFLDDAARNIGVPVTRIADGRDIWDVFRDVRFLGNSRVDPCSRILKREVLDQWVSDNCDPTSTALVFGLSWDEPHRIERIRGRHPSWQCLFPLDEAPYLTKPRVLDWARSQGLKPPRLYSLGFDHANCGGGCVKAGQAQFALLLRVLPDVYAGWERNEEASREQLGNVSILRDRTGGESGPLPLREFRERIERGQSYDLFDGGSACSCFTEASA